MKLYAYWRSTSSWRVRIALHHKGVPFEYQAVHLLRDGGEQNAPGYQAVNPQSQVPVLELDDSRRITQSLAIIEYLEERFPLPPLLPADPYLRARARMLAEIVNAGIQPYHNTPVLGYIKQTLGADEQAWMRHFISRGLAALERSAAETAGPFLAGPAPTVADVCLVPQLYAARRYGVDVSALPVLLAAEQACEPLPAFASARPERQPDSP